MGAIRSEKKMGKGGCGQSERIERLRWFWTLVVSLLGGKVPEVIVAVLDMYSDGIDSG